MGYRKVDFAPRKKMPLIIIALALFYMTITTIIQFPFVIINIRSFPHSRLISGHVEKYGMVKRSFPLDKKQFHID